MSDEGITVVGLIRICPNPEDGFLKNINVFRQIYLNTEFQFHFNEGGCPILDVKSANKTDSWTFNKIKFYGTGYMVLTLVTSDFSAPVLQLDEKCIGLNSLDSRVVEFRLNGRETLAYKPKYNELRDIHRLPLRERTFINKIQALESQILGRDEFEIIEATSKLRTLLLDDGLIRELLKEYRVRVRFSVSVLDHDQEFLNDWSQGFDYTIYSFPKKEVLDSGRFLNRHVGTIEGRPVKTRDIIELASNFLGPHHFGEDRNRPIDVKNQLFQQYETILVNGDPSVLRVMKDICFCYLEGIEVLVRAIMNGKR